MISFINALSSLFFLKLFFLIFFSSKKAIFPLKKAAISGRGNFSYPISLPKTSYDVILVPLS